MYTKTTLIIIGVYCAAYGCAYGAEVLSMKAAEKLIKVNSKRKLKKEEKRDLSKKAEAYGWDIVECEYTIEAV